VAEREVAIVKPASATAKADALFSKKVRASGFCFAKARYPCMGPLQCAHIIGRRYHATRWDLENAVPLCLGHHTYFTDHPNEWKIFIRENGIDYDALHRKASKALPEKPADALARLRA
jgi:hypothetical protein